jgi:hypothetical protein
VEQAQAEMAAAAAVWEPPLIIVELDRVLRPAVLQVETEAHAQGGLAIAARAALLPMGEVSPAAAADVVLGARLGIAEQDRTILPVVLRVELEAHAQAGEAIAVRAALLPEGVASQEAAADADKDTITV